MNIKNNGHFKYYNTMIKLSLQENSKIIGGDFSDRLTKQRNKCSSSGSCSRYYRMLARYARRNGIS